jgi:hypothetical protein
MAMVKFRLVTQAAYDALDTPRSGDILYFTSDTHKIYRGDNLLGVDLVDTDIPNLPASKITSGTFGVDRIPALSADKITSDELNVNRIPTLPQSKITGLETALTDVAYLDDIPTIPTISTNIQVDGEDNTRTASPKAVKTYVDGVVSGVYKFGGTLTSAQVVSGLLVEANEGKVYNVSEDFPTTSDFIEGTGITHEAGTNIVVVDTGGGTYKFDVLAGFVEILDATTTTKGIVQLSDATDYSELGSESDDAVTEEVLKAALDDEDYQTQIDSKADISPEVINYDSHIILALSNVGQVIRMTGSTMTLNVDIPSNSSVPIPIGTEFIIYKWGTRDVEVRISADYPGATLRAPDGDTITVQYQACNLRKIATDEWIMTISNVDDATTATKGIVQLSDAGDESEIGDINHVVTEDVLKDVAVLASKQGAKLWFGTQSEYDALGSYDENTVYVVDGVVIPRVAEDFSDYDEKTTPHDNDVLVINDSEDDGAIKKLKMSNLPEQDISGKLDANTAITGATKPKITYDAKGLVTAGADLAEGDIPNLPASKITTGTFDPARINSISYTDTCPTEANTDGGIKEYIGTTDCATKYAGWRYTIIEE